MRVISGKFRGRTINPPVNMKTRPTTDRVRESIFSSLMSKLGSFEKRSVFDAFAGSGALGIEALSRGAQTCVFFENNANAMAVLRKNINSLKITKENAIICKRDVFLAVKSKQLASYCFDLVLLDPPYAFDSAEIAVLLQTLQGCGCLNDGAVIMYEHATNDTKKIDEIFAQVECFKQDGSRKFGSTTVSYFIVSL